MALAKDCETLAASPLKAIVLMPAALSTSKFTLPLVLVASKLVSVAVSLTAALVPEKIAPLAIKAKAFKALP